MKRRPFILLAVLVSLLTTLPLVVSAAPDSRASVLPAQDAGRIWRNYTNAHFVNALAVEGDTVWVATWGGVLCWDRGAGAYVKFTTIDSLVNNRVNTVAFDVAGHKWFGTDGGVSEFDGVRWTTYTTDDGLAGNRVWDIAMDHAGHKWFGTDDGVSEFDGHTWTTYLPGKKIKAIAIDDMGHKWCGTWGNGVIKFDRSTSNSYMVGGNYITALAITVQGTNGLEQTEA